MVNRVEIYSVETEEIGRIWKEEVKLGRRILKTVIKFWNSTS